MISLPPQGHQFTPRVIEMPTNTKWWRISHASHTSSIYFGRQASYRWDAPTGDYGVLYLGDSVDCAFSETVGHGIMERFHPDEEKIIGEDELCERKVHLIRSDKILVLADFSGAGISALNLDNRINTTVDYTLPQQWSQWIHEHSSVMFDGICYRSRHLPDRQAIALFDRAGESLSEEDFGIVRNWKDPQSGRTILDILEEQGWYLV